MLTFAAAIAIAIATNSINIMLRAATTTTCQATARSHQKEPQAPLTIDFFNFSILHLRPSWKITELQIKIKHIFLFIVSLFFLLSNNLDFD